MSLSRLAVVCALAATATCSFAADPKAEAVASALRAKLESVHLVPWFSGMHPVSSKPELDGHPFMVWKAGNKQVLAVLSDYTCLKLRTYRVKRQESFSKGESGTVEYSTCQWASNYELRSTVETQTLDATPRK